MVWYAARCVRRVMSLNPIPGYEVPTLAGHKDHIVGVFFVPPRLAQSAEVRRQ